MKVNQRRKSGFFLLDLGLCSRSAGYAGPQGAAHGWVLGPALAF